MKFKGIITFTDVYGSPPKEEDFSNIIKIPQVEVLLTVAGINARLHPIDAIDPDYTPLTQINCLRAIFLDDKRAIKDSVCHHEIGLIGQLLGQGKTLFTRVTCMYAFNESLRYGHYSQSHPKAYYKEERMTIFKFLLACNEALLQFDKGYGANDNQALGDKFFEFFMFKELPHNQYYALDNIINFFFRASEFLNTLQTSDKYGGHLTDYLNSFFGLDLVTFQKQLVSIALSSTDRKIGTAYIQIDPQQPASEELIKFLDAMARKTEMEIPEKADISILDFISIKKSPLFKSPQLSKNGHLLYVIPDIRLLAEKVFTFFMNDFWFDYLKPNDICGRADWGNFIGSSFFEPYLEALLRRMHSHNKKVELYNGQELTFDFGKRRIEVADFILKRKNKLIVIQAKSSFLANTNGFKTVVNKDDYKHLNLDRFYSDFGLKQLAEISLKLFQDYKWFFQNSLVNQQKQIEIYPVIMVQEPIIGSEYASIAFKKAFIRLLEQHEVEKEDEIRFIHNLTIIHVSELEIIEQSICDGDESLFNLIRHHLSVSSHEMIRKINDPYVLTRSFKHSISILLKRKAISRRARNGLKALFKNNKSDF